MIRTLARVAALLAALAAATPAHAQEKGAAGHDKNRIGFGISLSAFDFVNTELAVPPPPTAALSMNFDVGALRLEPSLGIGSFSIDGGQKGRDFNLGCGLLFPVRPGRSVSLYVGPRLFLGFVSANNGTGRSDTGVDLTVAGVFGAEWFADPRFSIGAEARLAFASRSELSDAGVILRHASTQVGTAGLVYFRFYP